MTFITDRCWDDILRIKQGDHSLEALSRGTLLPETFHRWKKALLAINPNLVLPEITYNTQINTTIPNKPIHGVPEYYTITPLNDCWYYWKAIDDLRKSLPSTHSLDLENFPNNMENLTFANVNTLEIIIEYFYNNLNK